MATSGNTRPAQRTRDRKRGGAPSLAFLLLGAAAGLLVVASLGIVYSGLYADRVVPGVRVGPVDVGARTPAEADARLRTAFDQANRQALTFVADGGRQWQIAPADLGISLDAGPSLEAALAYGRDGNAGENLGAQLDALRAGVSLTPALMIDEARFRAAVTEMASSGVETPFMDASVSLKDGRATVIPPQAGLRIDDAGIREQVVARLESGDRTPIVVELTRSEPSRSLEAIQPLLAQAQTMIGSALVLEAVGKKVTLQPRELAAMLVIEDNGRGGVEAIAIGFDPVKVKAIQDRVAREVNQAPENARYAFAAADQLREIKAGKDGISLQADRFPSFLDQAARSQGRTVQLPVEVTKPYGSDPAGLGIKERISRATTNYAGGAPERVKNVELGARLLNGVLIPPGATFSFNDTVGAISAEAGFQMGFAIIENETVPDAGGGICQVSTNLFQAAFFGGYPIVERWAHAYDITRYHAPYIGLDATIYTGSLDFRFTNSQSTALLIQTSTDGVNLYVSLFGTKPNWTVDVKAPVKNKIVKADETIIRQESPTLAKGREYWVERAADGFETTVQRVVSEPGKEPRSGTFRSSYRPQRNVLLVGTGGEPAKPPTITPAPGSTATPAVSGTPTATGTAAATARPGTATVTPRPGTPTATPAATPAATPKPAGTATPAPAPTAAPKPSSTPPR